MANQEHLDILKQGVAAWNQWREEHADIRPDLIEAHLVEEDLRGADLSRANLRGAKLSKADLSTADLSAADLRGAKLSKADLSAADLSAADLREANCTNTYLAGADLSRANLRGAKLSKADLSAADLSAADLREANCTSATLAGADLSRADLSAANLTCAGLGEATLIEATLIGANLSRAYLFGVDLSSADLSGADLSGANLSRATLVETNLTETTLTQSHIYGISVWNVQLEGAIQNDLVITSEEEPTITVDNLEVAQFIYLLLNSSKIRDIIDTVARKAVLILGRFTPEREAVLDALRETLRTHEYVPILFDFDRPGSRNVTETVKILVHLSRFIIVDLTDPSSIPQELSAIVPTLAVPVCPILLEGKKEYALSLDFLTTYHWMLPIHFYKDQAALLATLEEQVIEPAEQKARELEKR